MKMPRKVTLRNVLTFLLFVTVMRAFTFDINTELLSPALSFQQSESSLSVPATNNKNHSIVFVHVGKTGGETIKWRLKVTCKIRGSKRKKERCLEQFRQRQESRLSQSTIGYMHCGARRPRFSMSNTTAFLFSIRDPIVSPGDRIQLFHFPFFLS